VTSVLVVYGLVVGVLLCATARALEGILTVARRPVRWIWGTAFGVLMLITGLAVFRTMRPASPSANELAGTNPSGQLAPAGGDGILNGLLGAIEAQRHAIELAAGGIVGRVASSIPETIERLLPFAWLLASAVILVVLGLVYLRVNRLHRRCPAALVQGVPVRVAANTGPAVFGLLRPEIVIPSWLLNRSATEQRLVLDHELEHVRVGDPLLLAGACFAVAIMPWNPAAWWMLARLRLAVELDCDARVLRRGAPPRRYGELLIELAGIRSEIRAGVAALAGRPSQLEQRLLAMKPGIKNRAPARVAALASFGALGLVSLIVACDVPLPTATEVANMNVASAEVAMKKLPVFFKQEGEIFFKVDGVPVSASQAHAIAPDQIATIDFLGAKAPGGKPEIRITKLPASGVRGKVHPVFSKRSGLSGTMLIAEGTATKAQTHAIAAKLHGALATKHPSNPVMMLNGVRVTPADIHALSPADIASVEIIKGAPATNLYGTPDAANGVISVTTKGARSVK